MKALGALRELRRQATQHILQQSCHPVVRGVPQQTHKRQNGCGHTKSINSMLSQWSLNCRDKKQPNMAVHMLLGRILYQCCATYATYVNSSAVQVEGMGSFHVHALIPWRGRGTHSQTDGQFNQERFQHGRD